MLLLENTTSLSFLLSSHLFFASLHQNFDVILESYFPYFLTFPLSINFYSSTASSQAKLWSYGTVIHNLFCYLVWCITWEVLHFSGEQGDCGLFFVYMNPWWAKCPSFPLQVQVEIVILSPEELLNRTDYGLSHVFSRHQKNKVCFLWIFLRTFTFKCKYAKWNFWLEIWVTSHTPHHFPLLPSRGVSFLSIPLGSHCCCLNLMLVQGSHGEDKQARRKWLSGCRLLVDPGSVAGCSTLQRTNLLFPTVTVESHSDLPLDLVTLTASVKTASHAMPGKCHSGSAWWDFHQGFWGKRRSQEWIGSVLQEAAVKQYWFVGSMQIQGRIGRKLPLSLFFFFKPVKERKWSAHVLNLFLFQDTASLQEMASIMAAFGQPRYDLSSGCGSSSHLHWSL